MTIKQELCKKCQEFIDHRLKTIKKAILDIEQGFQSETKNSAGDKHETGRAMLQLEREKAGQQLAEVQKLQNVLQKIDLDKVHSRVALGSVVCTSKSNYFIAVSMGEIKLKDQLFYAISPSTPLGKLLMSKTKGDGVNFRGEAIKIVSLT